MEIHSRLISALSIGASLLGATDLGCSGGSRAEPPGTYVTSSVARLTTPDTTPEEASALVAGNTDFALALYRQARPDAGNFALSPHSISTALAMTYAGARGATATQMAAALRFVLPDPRLHVAFDWLDLALASRGQGRRGVGSEPFTLQVLDALWAQDGMQLEPAFLDTLAASYGAGVHLVDFQQAAESARVAINAWVSDVTRHRITDLLAKGVVDDMTRLVLTNAVYLSAAWARPFDPDATEKAPFYLGDGTTRMVQTMKGNGGALYASIDGLTAVELPYDGDELAMLVVMPPQGGLATLEDTLDPAKLASIVGALGSTSATLTFPRFTVRGRLSVRRSLGSLGMQDAFVPGVADLSGIDGARDLYVQDVVHQAFVKVGEEGTVAAAATAVIVGVTAAPPPPLKIDRPFLFFIRDRVTGAVLFMGRVVDPSVE